MGMTSLVYRVVLCLSVDGCMRETIKTLEQVMAVRKETLPEDHPKQLASQ